MPNTTLPTDVDQAKNVLERDFHPCNLTPATEKETDQAFYCLSNDDRIRAKWLGVTFKLEYLKQCVTVLFDAMLHRSQQCQFSREELRLAMLALCACTNIDCPVKNLLTWACNQIRQAIGSESAEWKKAASYWENLAEEIKKSPTPGQVLSEALKKLQDEFSTELPKDAACMLALAIAHVFKLTLGPPAQEMTLIVPAKKTIPVVEVGCQLVVSGDRLTMAAANNPDLVRLEKFSTCYKLAEIGKPAKDCSWPHGDDAFYCLTYCEKAFAVSLGALFSYEFLAGKVEEYIGPMFKSQTQFVILKKTLRQFCVALLAATHSDGQESAVFELIKSSLQKIYLSLNTCSEWSQAMGEWEGICKRIKAKKEKARAKQFHEELDNLRKRFISDIPKLSTCLLYYSLFYILEIDRSKNFSAKAGIKLQQAYVVVAEVENGEEDGNEHNSTQSKDEEQGDGGKSRKADDENAPLPPEENGPVEAEDCTDGFYPDSHSDEANAPSAGEEEADDEEGPESEDESGLDLSYIETCLETHSFFMLTSDDKRDVMDKVKTMSFSDLQEESRIIGADIQKAIEANPSEFTAEMFKKLGCWLMACFMKTEETLKTRVNFAMSFVHRLGVVFSQHQWLKTLRTNACGLWTAAFNLFTEEQLNQQLIETKAKKLLRVFKKEYSAFSQQGTCVRKLEEYLAIFLISLSFLDLYAYTFLVQDSAARILFLEVFVTLTPSQQKLALAKTNLMASFEETAKESTDAWQTFVADDDATSKQKLTAFSFSFCQTLNHFQIPVDQRRDALKECIEEMTAFLQKKKPSQWTKIKGEWEDILSRVGKVKKWSDVKEIMSAKLKELREIYPSVKNDSDQVTEFACHLEFAYKAILEIMRIISHTKYFTYITLVTKDKTTRTVEDEIENDTTCTTRL